MKTSKGNKRVYDYKLIKKLFLKYGSKKKVAKELGCTRGTVQYALKVNKVVDNHLTGC